MSGLSRIPQQQLFSAPYLAMPPPLDRQQQQMPPQIALPPPQTSSEAHIGFGASASASVSVGTAGTGMGASLSLLVSPMGLASRAWLPYLDREHWWLSIRNWFRALGLEFVMSFFLSIIVATAVSLQIGPESFAVRSVTVGSVQMLAIFFFYSMRHTTPNLPRSLDPGLTFVRWIKRDSHLGIWTALPMIGMEYAGSALSSVFLAATGGSAVPNFAASLRPTSLAGAIGIEILLTSMRYWFILHNEASGKNRTESSVLDMNALLAGLGYFVCTVISYANGLYLGGNAVMYFGSAINLGFDLPAGSAYWAVAIFAVPCVSAVIAALLDVIFHNVTNMPVEYLAQMESSERAALETEKAILQKNANIASRYSV